MSAESAIRTATALPAPARHLTREARAEAMTVARNVVTLGASLAAGLGVALVVRLFAPRALGPAAFGALRFAENAAEMVFVVLTLGVDTLIRREAAVSPERTRGYLGGLLVVRVAAGAVLIAGIATALGLGGFASDKVLMFAVLGVAELLVVLNNTYSAYEQAGPDVRWVAAVNMASKFVWAALAAAALTFAPSGLAFASALLISEALRFAWMTVRVVRTHRPDWHPDLRLAVTAILASMPFYLNFLAHNICGRIGTWVLGATCVDREVGLFGAASNLAAVALLGMPLLSWVMVPSTSRAAQRSDGELGHLVGQILRVALLVTVPLVLVFALAAPFWTRLLFGPAYAPAAGALQLLAPTFALAYVSTVCAIDLIQRNRVRAVTVVSLGSVIVSAVLSLLLIRWGAALGEGGGARGAAWATLLTELAVTAAMLRLGWRREWNKLLGRTAGALALAVTAAVACVTVLRGLGPGAALTAGVAFVAVLGLTRAVGSADIRFCREVVRRRRSPLADD